MPSGGNTYASVGLGVGATQLYGASSGVNGTLPQIGSFIGYSAQVRMWQQGLYGQSTYANTSIVHRNLILPPSQRTSMIHLANPPISGFAINPFLASHIEASSVHHVTAEYSDILPDQVSEILNMSPGKLREFLMKLSEEEQLQSFLEEAMKIDSLVAHFSYWEKWFPEKIRKSIDNQVALQRTELLQRDDCLPLDLEKKFTPFELGLLFSMHGALQPTFGCSKGCKYCAYDAVPKVRDKIPLAQLDNLFKKYGAEIGKKKWLLYFASEFSDHPDYAAIHALAVEHGKYQPNITTSDIEDDEWFRFLLGIEPGYLRVSNIIKYGRQLHELDAEEAEPRFQHRKGVGVSFHESQSFGGLPCFKCGPLITPRGIYNVLENFCDDTTERLPQGKYIVPLEGISDEPIRVGDSLNEVLRSSIITSGPKMNILGLDLYVLYRKSGYFVVNLDWSNGTIREVKKAESDFEIAEYLKFTHNNINEDKALKQAESLSFVIDATSRNVRKVPVRPDLISINRYSDISIDLLNELKRELQDLVSAYKGETLVERLKAYIAKNKGNILREQMEFVGEYISPKLIFWHYSLWSIDSPKGDMDVVIRLEYDTDTEKSKLSLLLRNRG